MKLTTWGKKWLALKIECSPLPHLLFIPLHSSRKGRLSLPLSSFSVLQLIFDLYDARIYEKRAKEVLPEEGTISLPILGGAEWVQLVLGIVVWRSERKSLSLVLRVFSMIS